MRPVRYLVAMSLDGYIAGPNGEIDWIKTDPSVDFNEVYEQFDTVLLGRSTYDLTRQPGAPPWPKGWRVYVFSRTLRQAEHPAVTVVSSQPEEIVNRLRAESGRDIWLFGGGNLFASLLAERLVDVVEVSVMPVILGDGIPLAGRSGLRTPLQLIDESRSSVGIVKLRYSL